MNWRFWLQRPSIQLVLLALAVIGVYGHTLDVPFYLDDYLAIETNPVLQTWDWQQWRHYSPRRVMATATFALNYHLHGLDPAGYHVFNIGIHILATCLVWALVRGILRTPALEGRVSSQGMRWLPLVAALLFALHPLQTQAVTYLTQRMASLAALWYLAAVCAWLQACLSPAAAERWFWFGVAGLMAILAFHTKENTVTLPLAWLWLEIAFFPGRSRLLAAWMLLGCVVVGLALLAAMSGLESPWLHRLDDLTRETRWFDRSDYLAAQMKVLWWYVRLYFWPVGLRFDYALHHPPGWTEPAVIVAALGHVAVLGIALGFVCRQPLPAFGVLFYYTAHLVESSVIPIRDLVFEHRTYLPNAGLSLLVAWGLVVWLPDRVPPARRWWPGLTAVILLGLAWGTWQRNQLWRDPIAFWRQNVALTPEGYRPLAELGNAYFEAGRNAEAKQVAAQLIALLARKGWQPGQENLTWSEVVNIALAYSLVHRPEDAARVARYYLNAFTSPRARGIFHLLLGDEALVHKHFPEAERHYRQTLKYLPDNLDAWLSLGEALGAQGKLVQARDIFRTILQRWPGQPRARQRLALTEYLLRQRAGSSSR